MDGETVGEKPALKSSGAAIALCREVNGIVTQPCDETDVGVLTVRRGCSRIRDGLAALPVP